MSSAGQMKAGRGGYYYNVDRAEIVQINQGQQFPEAGSWEYLGSTEDMTPADTVAEVQERYPDVSVELEFHDLRSMWGWRATKLSKEGNDVRGEHIPSPLEGEGKGEG